MEQVLLCLQQTLSPDAQAREQAEMHLKQIEKSNGYTVVLLNIVAADQVDVHLRQSAAIALKRLTRSNWSEKIITAFDDEEDISLMNQDTNEAPSFLICNDDKKALKEKIVEAIICTPNKVRSQVGLALRNICDYEFPENWPELLPKILHFLSSQDTKVMIGALEALRLVVKKYEYIAPGKGRRKPLQNLTASVFPILIQLFQALQVPNAISIESAQLQVLLCKIFWSAINFGIPPFLQDDTNLLPWMGCFMSLLSRPIPEGQPLDEDARIRWPWWVAKKWVGQIFQRMYNRFGDASLTDGADMKAFAKKFEKNYAPKILEAFFNILAAYGNGGWMPPKLLNAAFNFIINGLRRPVLYKLLRPHLDKLLTGIIIPILRFTNKDLQLWKDDPQEYIRKEFDLEEEYYNPRAAALNLLVDVSNLRAKNHLAGIMNALASELTSYQTQPNPFVKEGTLVAIGAMVRKLIRSEYSNQLEPMLIAHVLPEFNSPHGFLRSRACWVYQQYWELSFTNQEALLRALQGVLTCMQDKELPVKVTAALALKYLLQNDTAEAEVRKILPQVVDLYFKLMNEIDNDELVNALEILITQFEEEMIPYATEITARLTQSFLRMLEADDEDSTVAAFECLSTIQTILESISTLPQLYPKMEEILLPLLDKLFTTDCDAEFLEDGFRIISFITCFSPSISQNMWTFFPRIYKAFKDMGNDYVGDLVTPIDNYVSKSTEVFLSGPYMNLVFDIYKQVVGDKETLEEHAGDATKLAEVLLFNCKGKIDNAIEPLLEIAIARLGKAKNTFLKVLLLEVISDSLFYNPALTLAILEKRNWLKDVFSLWLSLIPKFFRSHDKKVAILGLSSIFLIPQNMMPQLVQAGLGQVLSAVIQLVMNLENQEKLVAEEQEKLKQEEEEDDDDDNEPIQELDDQEEVEDAELEKLMTQIQNADDQDDSEDEISEDEEHIEEEENYSSIIDDIDQVIFFVDCMKTFHQNDANSYNGLSNSLSVELQNNFKEICELAEKNKVKLLERQQQQLKQ